MARGGGNPRPRIPVQRLVSSLPTGARSSVGLEHRFSKAAVPGSIPGGRASFARSAKRQARQGPGIARAPLRVALANGDPSGCGC